MLTVGVVAVQGDFAEHIALLNELNVTAREVRLPKDLEGLDALIIPGGESTTPASPLRPLRALRTHHRPRRVRRPHLGHLRRHDYDGLGT